MKKESTTLFWIAEINLVLWMATAGTMLFGNGTTHDNSVAAKSIIITGCAIAAILQHIAYHKIYKPIRRQEKKQSIEPTGDTRAGLFG